MIAKLKPYPAVKDSGVEWLGEVPEHWETPRIKTLLREKEERNGNGDGVLLSLTRARGIVRQSEASDRLASALDLSKYKVCNVGDLVMNRMQAWSGMFAVSPIEGVISPDYSIFELISPYKAEIKYFEHLFKTPQLVDQFAQRSKGIGSGFNRLYTPDFGSIIAVLPSLPEQAAIVKYLDYVDRRVRRLIRAKRKLMALLTEQKQAIIHRAVTRGIDPGVPLKDSGVEWLGEVPAHWEVRRVKSLSLVKRGASPRPIADSRYFDESGEYSWVRIADVTSSNHYLEKTTQRLSKRGESLSVKLRPDSIFLSIAGSVGKPIITKIKCCIHDGFVYFPQFTGNIEFLYRVFSAGTLFGRLGKLGTQLNLNTDTVGKIFVGWPPENEQAGIVVFLDQATAITDTAITRAQREIDLLWEYRTRLIADVVTGKLDVREAAATIPEVDSLAENGELDDTLDNELEVDFDELNPIPEEDEA